MPIPQDISPNVDPLVDDPLDGKAAGVNEWVDVLDVD
jgi:hypothetical protein